MNKIGSHQYGHSGAFHLAKHFGGFGHRHGFRRRMRWHGLNPYGSSSNASDPQILAAQACLAQLVDPTVPQDGILGQQTRQAIRSFQSQQNIPFTGMLDANTSSALQSACSSQASGAAGGANAGPPASAPGGSGLGHNGTSHEVGFSSGEAEGEEGEEEGEFPFGPFGFRHDRRERFAGRRPWDHDRRVPWVVARSFDGSADEIRDPRFAFRPAAVSRSFERLRPARPWNSDRAYPGNRFWEDRAPLENKELILWAQSCLANVLGPWVARDGVFSLNTQRALARFQEQQSLSVTGQPDKVTISALRAVCAS